MGVIDYHVGNLTLYVRYCGCFLKFAGFCDLLLFLCIHQGDQ